MGSPASGPGSQASVGAADDGRRGRADATAVGEFLEVMRRTRADCAWKQQQTHRSLQR